MPTKGVKLRAEMSGSKKIFSALIHYTKFALAAMFFVFLWSKSVIPVYAGQQHYTLIINQVRGADSFDTGNVDFFHRQVDSLRVNKLTATFAIRYDTLNPTYLPLIRRALTDKNEIGALLEITPALASDSNVAYRATTNTQYLSANAYLLGYSQQDRRKLIDTYMAAFKSSLGFYPRISVAWMIDAYSLQYLFDNYHITAHEITREQWNTDSSTLYGGPPHYPYYPSRNWALIPSTTSSSSMPLIIRQTITDPVENYGDFTDSHTSQPNDYARSGASFSYFEYLFNQAHNQNLNPYTFAVVGLENSMAGQYQEAFIKQLEYISAWQKNNPDNQVMTAFDFVGQNPKINAFPQIYEGATFGQPTSRAWWITTPSYRVRIRLDAGTLYISDIRVYDQGFTDPYLENPAKDGAFWVVPFLIDGSRFLSSDSTYQYVLRPLPDGLIGRKSTWRKPTRIELKNNVSSVEITQLAIQANGKTLVSFVNDWFEIPDSAKFILDNSIAGQVVKYSGEMLSWGNFIGLTFDHRGSVLWATPKSNASQFKSERETNFELLLPHLSNESVDIAKSILYVNNRYSVFGRNPIRLIYYPVDSSGRPASMSPLPRVATNVPAKINVGAQSWLNGSTWIDISPEQPGEIKVDVRVGNSNLLETVYSAPDCKSQWLLCLSHPKYAWKYLHTILNWLP